LADLEDNFRRGRKGDAADASGVSLGSYSNKIFSLSTKNQTRRRGQRPSGTVKTLKHFHCVKKNRLGFGF
jgi:hypothetical protein